MPFLIIAFWKSCNGERGTSRRVLERASNLLQECNDSFAGEVYVPGCYDIKYEAISLQTFFKVWYPWVAFMVRSHD